MKKTQTNDTRNTDNNNNELSSERYAFWINNPHILYKNDAYINFVPTSDMTRVEQLNALSRFFIYLIVLLFMFGRTDMFIYIPIIGVLITIILYNIFEVDKIGMQSELMRMRHKKDPSYIQKDAYNASADISLPTEHILESGYYDFDGKLQIGAYNDIAISQKKQNNAYDLNTMRLYDESTCRKPTIDNPFMNPCATDFNNNAPIACNSNEEDIELKFNADLYRNQNDVFDRQNSQRQFYTIAYNIPTDQEAFANWCYKFPVTCKTDQQRCLRYEDLRLKY